MFNPAVMTRLADLLQQGVIMKRKFQPHEAHLQYLLQFMTDYNLYGCDYVDSSQTYFRSPIPEYQNDSLPAHLWHSASVPAQYITDDSTTPRASHCSIEVDICVEHITNRKKVRERRLHHDFTEYTCPTPVDVKLVSSMAGLWKDESRRRKRQMLFSKQSSSSFPPETLISMSADPRQSQAQLWVHEDEYRQQIQELIAKEHASYGHRELEFNTFVSPQPRERFIKTALQSVEDLFPLNLGPLLGIPSGVLGSDEDPRSSIEVDEQKARLPYEKEGDIFQGDSDSDVQQKNKEIPQISEEGINPIHGMEVSAIDEFMQPNPYLVGVSLSAFKTDQLPNIPISVGLLDTIESNHLVGKSNKNLGLILAERTQLKRSASYSSNLIRRKRIKEDGRASPTRTQASSGVPSSSRPAHDGKSMKFLQSLPQPRIGSSWPCALSSPHQPIFPGSSEETGLNPKQYLTKNNGHLSPYNDSFLNRESHDLDTCSGNLGGELPSSFPSVDFEDISFSGTDVGVTTAAGSQNCKVIYSVPPPDYAEVATMHEYGLPDVLYQEVFYGKESDVPTRKREYAGKEFRVLSNTLPFLPEFDLTGVPLASQGIVKEITSEKGGVESDHESQRKACSWRSWEIADPPPSYQQVIKWLDKDGGTVGKAHVPVPQRQFLSQIDAPTPRNKHGFKYTPNQKSTSVRHEVQYMSTMSLELHVNTRGGFVPNPEEDEIQCIFWSCKADESMGSSQQTEPIRSGILVLCTEHSWGQSVRKTTSMEVIEESSELDLMVRIVEIVRTYDPDILTGYEVHGGSWGYLIERARLRYDYDLCDELSRMKVQSHGRSGKQSDRWGFNTTSSIRVTGRHMINVWRAMRGELNLLQYTMENVVWHLLHRRIPHYSWKSLTTWYQSGQMRDLHKLLRYYQTRTELDLSILEFNELIPRTSEQARLLGVDFFSVFSRGSQFKVESIMFRIAKPENFILVSPSRKQVGGQNALECLPLVMEPQSAFYNSPLLVLDFQSLYPSIMIAYNYCYSTFLGRITNWRGKSKMGFTEYERQDGLLELLKHHVNIAPNGMMYAKTEIRKSLLAKMLTEILETRIMVKNGMKQDKDDKTLQQLLNNRQLALKLLANVTYGYTSASFSGRMPCSEIADSIVQTGRETLERATAYIHSNEQWGAEVVYGDTDSLFIYLKGRTRDQAFEIGNEIAKAITAMNPRPIKLKFEKVYHPCVLLTKKRYVGYKYESRDQVKPEFDAKGIETVRRDGTPAEQKIEEKALKLLFETADLSQIKEYFQKQCGKIMRGQVSIQDFCFAREVRLGTYSDKGLPPAGALISTRRMLEDARAEPQYGERVPYVVITGAPGARLIDRCVAPEDLIRNPHWQLDAEYYISKNLIPPLERIFNLVGANVRQWYDEMPKVRRVNRIASANGKKSTLESYMKSTHCLVCGKKFVGNGAVSLCRACAAKPSATLLSLQEKLKVEDKRIAQFSGLE
ncbi:DNA polymerase zeta catalytic subunit [Cladobotryum mycophilum]|uniref:DNA polymerase n=1 Tax=Cladobotryum mycophilum TaxID=491253 RepID=A0ABR0T3E3_9HYPO